MADVDSPLEMPAWAVALIRGLKLPARTHPKEVMAAASLAADQLAPDTRRLWKLILLLEGAAVMAPLLWLLVVRLGWSVSYAAAAVAGCTLIVIGICWWLRWRGMQQTWARARLLAEIARSAMATSGFAPAATLEALAGSPGLQPVARWILANAPEDVGGLSESWQGYVAGRIDDQLTYYRSKHAQAAADRRRLSRYVTVSLDGALFLAVSGVALSMNHSAERWLRLSGSDYVLGIVGTVLPLVAILMQSLGSYLELNRRAGRYAQQIEFLESVRTKSGGATSAEEIHAAAREVERTLLSEVVEWFYQAQHTEPYYRSRNSSSGAAEIQEVVAVGENSWSRTSMVWLGISAAFVGRVLLGRVLVVALSVVVTTALIAFYVPRDSVELSKLRREDGRLLSSPTADGWTVDPARAEHGFILIAHGLHDGVETSNKPVKGELHWMTRMQNEIGESLGPEKTPDICLVDWRLAAQPATFSGMGRGRIDTNALSSPIPPEAWLQDIAAIRSQGEEIGELVGFKIAKAIRTGLIRKDRPMHFIGHSAGGFVVLHAALVLQQLGFASADFRVTLLDSPLPVVEQLKLLSDEVPVDFYRTSAFAAGIPDTGFGRHFTRFDIQPPAGIDPYTGAHSYAHQWYIETITDAGKRGFGLSPFRK